MLAALPTENLQLSFKKEIGNNLELWSCVPKQFSHLVTIQVGRWLGEWNTTSRKFIGRIVTYFLFCPQKNTKSQSLQRALWGGVCTDTGTILSGIYTMVGREYQKFSIFIDEELTKHDRINNKQRRGGNCNHRITYNFHPRSGSLLRDVEVEPMFCNENFDEYRTKYIVEEAFILDNRPQEKDYIIRQRSSKIFTDMAPNISNQVVFPTLKVDDQLFHVRSKELAKRIKLDSNNLSRSEDSSCEGGSSKKLEKIIKIYTINRIEEYFWTIITKWRGFDQNSIYLSPVLSLNQIESGKRKSSEILYGDSLEMEKIEQKVPGLYLNLPKFKTIPEIKSLTEEQTTFVNYIRHLLVSDGGPKRMHVLSLTGPAGSGKTKCLDILQQYKTLYVTCKGQLVQDINQSCRVSLTMTWAKFGMTLMGMSFFQWLKITNSVVNIDHSMRETIFQTEIFRNLPIGEKAAPIIEELQILYIDEFSMISYGEITLILELLKRTGTRLIVILVGDPAQIPPINSHMGTKNASIIIQDWVEQCFELRTTMRFEEEKHAENMDKLRNIILNNEPIEKITDLIEKQFVDKICLCPRFDIQLYYPTEVCPTPQFVYYEKNYESTLRLSNDIDSLEIPPVINLMMAQQTQKPNFTNFYIKNTLECLAWIDKYKKDINSFVCFHMTNLNVHLGILAYCRALHQVCGAPVMYVKIFTIIQTSNKKSPFFGLYNSDRIQVLPLIVGHQYVFMESGTIIKKGAKLTLLYVDQSGEDRKKCEFLIVVDEYKIFYKLAMRHYTLPLLCSNRRNYMCNYPPDQKEKMTNSVLYEVYGFPLTLACFSNIYQSQGTTISEQNVFLNLMGCTINEIYVGMSRCRSSKQIVQILL